MLERLPRATVEEPCLGRIDSADTHYQLCTTVHHSRRGRSRARESRVSDRRAADVARFSRSAQVPAFTEPHFDRNWGVVVARCHCVQRARRSVACSSDANARLRIVPRHLCLRCRGNAPRSWGLHRVSSSRCSLGEASVARFACVERHCRQLGLLHACQHSLGGRPSVHCSQRGSARGYRTSRACCGLSPPFEPES